MGSAPGAGGKSEPLPLQIHIASFDPKALLVNVGNLHTLLAIGCEYTVKAGEIYARFGYQGGQPEPDAGACKSSKCCRGM